MAKCSKYMARVLRVIGFALIVQVALACALIPNEHEGLLGRFLMASEEKIEEIGQPSVHAESKSFIFPLSDEKVYIYRLTFLSNKELK
jgi:hypothetical protein